MSFRRVRFGVLLASVAVVSSGLSLPAEAFVPDAPQTADQPPESSGADAGSAMAAARESGDRVEDLSQRTETAQVFANPDGTWTSEVAAEPVRVQESDGEWHDVDTTLVERNGKLEPAHAVTDLSLSDGGERTFAALSEDGRDLSWQWASTLPEPTVEGSTATYPDVIEDGDLVVTATSTGFTHSLVLRERPSEPVEFTMPVGLDGAQLTESAATGELTVTAPDGDVVASAPQPLMWDSSEGVSGSPENVEPVDAAVTQTPTGGTRLTLSPDGGFLADPDTEYPVTVDPGYSVFTTGDTWIMNADFNGSQHWSQELRAGTYDGSHLARALMQFDVSGLNGRKVTEATLRLRNHYAGSCTAGSLRAYRVTSNWSLTGVTWANQPAVDAADYDDYSPAHGDTSCAEDNAYWVITNMVKSWVEGTAPNYGVRIRAASETNTNTWRKYRSADYTTDPLYAPRLITTYEMTAPTSLSVSPARGSSTPSLEPTLSAYLSDGDGQTLTGEFQVFDAAGAEIWTGTTPSITSPGIAAINLPAEVVNPGSSYAFRVRTLNGAEVSAYSAAKAFTVDPMASTVPAPSCTTDCHAIPEVALLPSTTLGANESRLIDVTLPDVAPDLIDRVLLNTKATDWSGAGSITIYDPDYPGAEPPTLSYGAGDVPTVGVSTTVAGYTSYDTNQLKLTNNSSSTVTVNLSAYGWFEAPIRDDTDATDEEVDSTLVDLDEEGDEDQVDEGSKVELDEDRMAYFIAGVPAAALETPVEEEVPCPAESDPSSECTMTVDLSATPTASDLAALDSAPDDDPAEAESGAGGSTSSAAVAMSAPTLKGCNGIGNVDRWVLRTRYLACMNAFASIVHFRNGVRIGQAYMWFQYKIRLHWDSPTINLSYREVYSGGWGTGVSVSNDHKVTCFNCDLGAEYWASTTPYSISALSRVTAWDQTNRTVSVSQGEVVDVKVGFATRGFMGGSMVLTSYKRSYDGIRCDRVAYLQAGAGCVFKRYIPTLKMSLSGTAPASAKHIRDSQMYRNLPGAKTEWGGVGGPLTRKYWGTSTNRNRVVKDRLCRGLKRPTGYECDEYPFASTDQGCYVRCHVRMIPGWDNRRGGNILNNSLYRAKRVIDGDAFWVRIVP